MEDIAVTITIIILVISFIFLSLVDVDGDKFNLDKFTLNNFMNFTPPIYYINLDQATDRKKRFIENNSKSFKVKRIKAISPDDYNTFQIIKPDHCKNSELELCCTLSHLKAMHRAYYDNNEYALIMEDDMYFLQFPNWKELIGSAPDDWDILQLYTINTDIYKIKTDNWFHSPTHDHGNHISSCGAYLINRKALKKFLEMFIPNLNPKWDSIKKIDFTKSTISCTADFFIYQNMKTYVYTKILLNTEGFDSYLHPDHLSGHLESIQQINELNSN